MLNFPSRRQHRGLLCRSLLSLAVAALSLAAHGQTAGQASAGTSASDTTRVGSGYRALRVSQLIGMNVRGTQGNDAGKIEDVVVDVRTGKIRYALLSFDPGILSAEQVVPVPVARLRMGNDRDSLVYEASREELRRTAAARAEWTDSLFADPGLLGRLNDAWGLLERDQPRDQNLRMASRLLGKDVKDRAQQSAGRIEELVLDLASQRVHYAVVSLERGWLGMDKRVVLPLQALQESQGQGDLVLRADKARLQQMQAFDQGRYADLNSTSFRSDVDRWLAQANSGQAVDTRAAGAGAGSGAATRSND